MLHYGFVQRSYSHFSAVWFSIKHGANTITTKISNKRCRATHTTHSKSTLLLNYSYTYAHSIKIAPSISYTQNCSEPYYQPKGRLWIFSGYEQKNATACAWATGLRLDWQTLGGINQAIFFFKIFLDLLQQQQCHYLLSTTIIVVKFWSKNINLNKQIRFQNIE